MNSPHDDQQRHRSATSSKFSSLGRRQFIRILALGGGATAAVAGARAWTKRQAPVQATRLLMGSIANLTVLTGDHRSGSLAIANSFARMQELERMLSRFLPNSQLTQLNQTGRCEAADPALIQVVERAIEYGDLTRGAFDISVEPLLARYRQAVVRGMPIEQMQPGPLLDLVDYRRIEVRGDSIRLPRPGMAITLDGIAKGYVIDAGVAALRTAGYEQVLVEVGGDLVAGTRPDRDWQVGVRSPRPGSNPWVGTVSLRDEAMASSGDYLNSFSQDLQLHHILDPRQGLSPAELAGATVTAPTAMDADALSTSLMVLGLEAGMKLVDRLPASEALLITKNQDVHRSAGFRIQA